MAMIQLQQHWSEDGTRSARVWQSLGKYEYYVEYDNSGNIDVKCFLESEAEDYAEDYVLGIDDLTLEDGDSDYE